MITLFFDIETIPCDEAQKDIFLEILRKKAKGEANDDDLHAKMSFEGTFGRICCIAMIKEDENTGKFLIKETFSGDEKEILKKFWQAAQGVHRFVGHNIWEFDLPFIYKRSIINGVPTRTDISFARYRNLPIYDTLKEWELWNTPLGRAQKLDTLAKVFGLPTSKDEMDGSEVWDYYKQGKIADICKYCMKDVVLTRQVYQRMTFAETQDDEFAARAD